MEVINYVSIALSSMCIALSIIVLLCVLTDYSRKSRLNRFFRIFILFNIGIIASDIAAYIMEGKPEQYAYYIVRATNFLHYVFGALILAAMTFYIIAYLETKIKVPRIIKDVVLSLCALSMILTIVSQFTGLYYFIDEHNVYHRGDVFWLSQVLPMVGMGFNMVLVLYYRKIFERKFLFFFLAFMILPTTAVCLALFFYGITFINIASTLSVLLLYISVQIDHTHNMVMRLKLMDNQLELQRVNYKVLQTHMDEVRKARHDLRHHLSVFQAFIDTGEEEKLAEYIREYKAALPDDAIIAYCGNYAINSVLMYYTSIAKNDGITVDVHTEIPEKLNIVDSDLCIIFGNCVENAIEACRRYDGEKFINIKSMIIGDMLSIIIDNSFDGKLTKKGDTFASSKENSGGLGVSSVKSIVRKYNGEARFEAKANVFQASIMLHM